MRIHACATWRFKKEQYASLDTGEVCLPSYTCVVHRCNGSSDSTQFYTDVIRIPMILRCTLVE